MTACTTQWMQFVFRNNFSIQMYTSAQHGRCTVALIACFCGDFDRPIGPINISNAQCYELICVCVCVLGCRSPIICYQNILFLTSPDLQRDSISSACHQQTFEITAISSVNRRSPRLLDGSRPMFHNSIFLFNIERAHRAIIQNKKYKYEKVKLVPLRMAFGDFHVLFGSTVDDGPSSIAPIQNQRIWKCGNISNRGEQRTHSKRAIGINRNAHCLTQRWIFFIHSIEAHRNCLHAHWPCGRHYTHKTAALNNGKR